MSWNPESYTSPEVREEIKRIDKLGNRIVEDHAAIVSKRKEAEQLEYNARKLRREADDIERLLETARRSL